jgi:hypothetical protein
MQHIKDLLAKVPKDDGTPSRKTERGELMRYFCAHLNAGRATDGLPLITMSRMGKILEGIPTKDLYYLKSSCTRAKHFSKKFWWEVDPKKHEKENPF